MAHLLFSGGRNEPSGYSPTVWFKAHLESYNDNDTLSTVTNRGSAGSSCDLNAIESAPKFKTNIFNGYAAFYGDGNDGVYRLNIGSGTMIAAANGTVMVVCKPAVAAAGVPWMISETGVVGKANLLGALGSTVNAFNYDGSSDTTASKTFTTGTAYCLTWLHTGGNVSIGANDTRDASLSSTASGNTTVAAGDDLFLLSTNGANWFNGYVAEVIGFNTALTEAQRMEWERWFAYKYGLTIAY